MLHKLPLFYNLYILKEYNFLFIIYKYNLTSAENKYI